MQPQRHPNCDVWKLRNLHKPLLPNNNTVTISKTNWNIKHKSSWLIGFFHDPMLPPHVSKLRIIKKKSCVFIAQHLAAEIPWYDTFNCWKSKGVMWFVFEQLNISLSFFVFLQDSTGMRLWKRKWFVLADYCLFYYKGKLTYSTEGWPTLCLKAPLSKVTHCGSRYIYQAQVRRPTGMLQTSGIN